jgi:ribosomal protein S18 acetylase RimI-like enzyme
MDKTIITIREMNASDAWQVAEIEQSVFSEPWKEQDFIKV